VQNHNPAKDASVLNAAKTRLRRAGPADAAAVRELTRAAYAKWVPVIGREPMPMRVDHEVAVRDHLVDLLYVDDQLAALVEMIPAADHLLIENVTVLPVFQGRGYGRRLMAHAKALAVSRGLPEMRLYTNKGFAGNVRLYGRLGYQVDREEPFMGGVTVYMSKPLRSPVEHPVQKQLDAYNARDIDGFMQCWAADCEYYQFPSRLLAKGVAEVRERHGARFKEPNLHGRLVQRIVAADLVVDQEVVTRTFPDGPGEVDVVAIYEVADGLIARAWFRMGPPRLYVARE